MATGDEVWNLPDAEAKRLAKASADLAAFYEVKALNPKTQAWLLLLQVAGMTYGPRLYKTVVKKMDARKNPSASPVRPVTPAAPPQPPTYNVQSAPNGAQQPPAPTMETRAPPAPARSPVPASARTGEIPGVGKIEFPPNHPLAGAKPTLN